MDKTRRFLIGLTTALAVPLALPVVVTLALVFAALYYLFVLWVALRFLGRGVKSLTRRLAAWRLTVEPEQVPITLALTRRR